MSIRQDFEEWASTKDFYNITRPYPFDAYSTQEMQLAWIAWRAAYAMYYCGDHR